MGDNAWYGTFTVFEQHYLDPAFPNCHFCHSPSNGGKTACSIWNCDDYNAGSKEWDGYYHGGEENSSLFFLNVAFYHSCNMSTI